MQNPVLIEPIADNGCRARGGEPFPPVVEAATHEEVLAKFQAAMQDHLRNGAGIVPLETATSPHPLAKFVGMFKDDPWIDDMNQQIHPKDVARKTQPKR